MRLAYLATSRLPTESAHGHQIAKMCEAFSEIGIEVHLVHSFRMQPSPFLRHVTFANYYGLQSHIHVSTVPGVDLVRFKRFMPGRISQGILGAASIHRAGRVVRYARGESFDICFTREPMLAWWAQYYRLPTILELHRQPRLFNRALLERCLRSSCLRGVVTVTEALRERIVRLLPPGGEPPIITCPDAVDLRQYECLPDRETCRRTLELPANRRIIGYVGRFRSLGGEKGIPELIRAIPHLGSARERSLVLCVGGPMEAVAHYERVAREAGVSASEIRFVDRVPPEQVPTWIRACDVVTIPWPRTEYSAFFTSPLKMFEYMAAEVPIVASDLESLREVLTHGESALLAEPGSPAALGREIGRLLADNVLARRLARRARQLVEQYTWQARARMIHQQLLSGSRGHRRVVT